MKSFKWLILVLPALSICYGSAEVVYPVNNQVQRFTRYLDGIDQAIAGSVGIDDPKAKFDYFDNETTRMNLQELEDLAQMYSRGRNNQLMSDIYVKAKEFEDHISHYRDVKDFAVEAKGDAAVAKYKKNLENEVNSYTSFLNNSQWFNKENSLSQTYRKSLAALNWPSMEGDRNFLLWQLATYFERLQTKEYNLKEVDRGLHELRRDVRRLQYYNRTIDNLIYADQNRACPIGKSVPAVTPGPATSYNCKVSACLVNKLQEVDSAMSGARHEGLKVELRGEELQDDTGPRRVLTSLIDSGTYLHLISQIRSCATQEEAAK